jgi:hypothetical protein
MLAQSGKPTLNVLSAGWGRTCPAPADSIEAFQHRTQFVVAQLERRGRQKKHSLKHAAEWAANLLSVVGGVRHLE